jgi:hypothetical protein
LKPILIHNYKQLTKCISEVEQIIEAKDNKSRRLTIKEEGKGREAVNQARQRNNNSNVAVVLVPRQDEHSKKTTKRKKKLRIVGKEEEVSLDSYSLVVIKSLKVRIFEARD